MQVQLDNQQANRLRAIVTINSLSAVLSDIARHGLEADGESVVDQIVSENPDLERVITYQDDALNRDSLQRLLPFVYQVDWLSQSLASPLTCYSSVEELLTA